MKIKNKLMPNKKQIKMLSEQGPDTPIFIINLVKFKKKAVYADKRATNLSGMQAYRLYGQEVVKLLPEFNGELVFGKTITALLIGESKDVWDEFSVVKFDSRENFNAMIRSPKWNGINAHRIAGAEGLVNLESVDASVALKNEYEL